MKKPQLLTTLGLLCLGLFPVSLKADGDVSVTISPFPYRLIIEGDTEDNFLAIKGGDKKTLLIEARDGTTINGTERRFRVPSDAFNSIWVALRSGNDELDVEGVDLGTDNFYVLQDDGNAAISITESIFGNVEVNTGSGEDSVKLNRVAGNLVRIADSSGGFLLNAAVPMANSYISTNETEVKCLDLQARTVEASNHHGALLVATTYGKINRVDSTSGDANLSLFSSFLMEVEDSAVAVAAEYDSSASNIEIRDIITSEMAVIYSDTLLNDRTNSVDKISIDEVETETFDVGTGFGVDVVNISNVHATDDTFIDLGSESDQRNRDGSNFLSVDNLYAEGDVEIFGGSWDDDIEIEASYFAEDLDVETDSGGDNVEIHKSYVRYDSSFGLGAGSDTLISEYSYLGWLNIFGGSGKDEASQRGSGWRFPRIYDVEQHDF